MKANKGLFIVFGVVVVCLPSSRPTAQAAELIGVTRDAVSANGVSSVKVKLLTAEKKLYKNGLTDDSGRYRIQDVDAGNYLVFFEKTGFTATPIGANVSLKAKDTKSQDATLYPENPDASYLIRFAESIKTRATQSGSPRLGHYEREWEAIENSGLSTQFKTQLAIAIKNQDSEALKVSGIKNLVKDYERLPPQPQEPTPPNNDPLSTPIDPLVPPTIDPTALPKVRPPPIDNIPK